jgi:N-acetylglucosamine repressor
VKRSYSGWKEADIDHLERSQRDVISRSQAAVLNAVRDSGNLSRAQVSDASGLSLATVKRLVDELVSAGMLVEGSFVSSPGRGRKPSVVRMNGAYGHSIGLALQPGRLRATAISFDGSPIYHEEALSVSREPGELVEQLLAAAAKAIDACATAAQGPLLGVGIGVAGLVDARSGTVLYCPGIPGWENTALAALARERFGVPVCLDDSVRCMALAEKRYGAAKSLSTFLFLYIGLGVGSGIVLDNRIYRGANGASGEFGHITVKEHGPLCKCGNRGCLEALVSTEAILARARELIASRVYTSLDHQTDGGSSISLGHICSAAVTGDRLAGVVVGEIEENIGIGVANLINVFDPGTVVLAGEVVEEMHGLILEGVERIVRRRALHAISQRTAITKSLLPVHSGERGAATLVIEELLGNQILNV